MNGVFRGVAVAVAAAGLIIWALSAGGNANVLTESQAHGDHGGAADRAFVELLIPLDRQLAAIAEVGRTEGTHPQLRAFATNRARQVPVVNRRLQLLADRVSAQVSEARLPPLAQILGDSGALGQTPAETGLQLRLIERNGHSIDRRFLNQAIEIQQGALRIARVGFLEGRVPALVRFAHRILLQRISDIHRLNRWYREWFGRSAPAGGVPAGQ